MGLSIILYTFHGTTSGFDICFAIGSQAPLVLGENTSGAGGKTRLESSTEKLKRQSMHDCFAGQARDQALPRDGQYCKATSHRIASLLKTAQNATKGLQKRDKAKGPTSVSVSKRHVVPFQTPVISDVV